ncbi:MAG: GDP-mannose 4,6-dehydratase, partial [Anaerolineales bacterium]
FGAAGLDWETFVVVDERLYRPAEVHELRGNPRKARERFGWVPTVTFSQLVDRMVEADIRSARDATLQGT